MCQIFYFEKLSRAKARGYRKNFYKELYFKSLVLFRSVVATHNLQVAWVFESFQKKLLFGVG